MAVAYFWPEDWKTPREAALGYARVGWKIFPCYFHTNAKTRKEEKKPCPGIMWKTGAATTDVAQIEAWWAKWPDALVGHIPGSSGHVVIDVDVKNGGKGEEQWLRLNGPREADTMIASTRNKGRHIWFKKEPFDQVSYFDLDTNLEVRSDTVYVILPSPGSGYAWGKRREPKEMPAWLVKRIADHENAKNSADDREIEEADYDAALKKLMQRIRVKSAVSFGDRSWLKVHVLEKEDMPDNDIAKRFEVVHRMERLLYELGMTDGECFALVWRSGWCKFRFDRKNGEKQLEKEIRAVYGDGDEPAKKKETADGEEAPPLPKRLSEVDPQPNNFTYYPYLPQGEAVILAGPGGVGKGLAAGDMASRVSRAARWPLIGEKAPRGNVIWMEEEDSIGKTLRVRLEAMSADLTRIIIMDAAQFKHYVTRQYVVDNDVRLIVLSPLLSALELDSNINEVGVRREFARMKELFRDLPVTLLGLMHPNKKHDQSAVDRVSGSTAFTTFPRCALIINVERPKDDEEEQEDDDRKFRLTHQKKNLSVRGNDLIGTITNARPDQPRGQWLTVKWAKAEINIAIDTALDRKKKKKEGEERQSAGAWLEKYLRENGRMLRGTIMEDAAKWGPYTEEAVNQARKRFGAKIKIDLTGPPGHEKSFWEWVK